MTSRPLAALLLAASLFGSMPEPALETAGGGGDSLSLAHAAVAASSSAAEPIVFRGAPASRPMLALPAPVPAPAPCERAPAAHVAPLVQAARPDVVTCPSQGPPAAG